MTRLRGIGGLLLVVILVVADIALIGLAVHHSHRSVATSESVDSPSLASPLPTTSASPSSTVSASPPVITSAVQKSAEPLLSAFTTSVALIATGGCSGTATLSETTNGGVTQTALTPPALHILRIDQTSATSEWVVGANAQCAPTYYSSTDSGTTWTPGAALGQIWVALKDGVHRPNGALATPCSAKHPEPVALAPGGTNDAIVICAKGVFRTTSGGKSFVPAGTLPTGKAVTAALDPSGHGVLLLAGAAKCPGLRVMLTRHAGKTWTAGRCLTSLSSPAAVALTATGGGLAVSGNTSYTSSNFGRTWS